MADHRRGATGSPGGGRRTAVALLSGAALVTGLLAVPAAGAATAAHGGPSPNAAAGGRFVVQAGSVSSAAAAVHAVGGSVRSPLPIVDGVAASLTPGAVERLRRQPGVRAVTADAAVQVSGDLGTGDTAAPAHLREVDADVAQAAGVRGKGIRIALVDTGVTPVGDVRDRLVRVADPMASPSDPRTTIGPIVGAGDGTVACVNFSSEPDCEDRYGHGTFLAGLMVGSGAASGGLHRGVADRADIVSIKIAGRDGSADVSKVLGAIQWATSFKDQYGIRVLNLSLGTPSTNHPSVDPLNLAVQRAWRAGLVVVVAASNRGPAASTISKPGDDPLVLTVGATNDRTTPAVDDDRIPNFSGRGPTAQGLAKPDVVAPGAHLLSLRAPGSTAGAVGGGTSTYRAGSGTSMSAAVVSGAVAAVLSAQPAWTPDRVKHALASTARLTTKAKDPNVVGTGVVSITRALAAGPGLANQSVPTSLLATAAGVSDRVATATLDVTRGQVDPTTGAPGDQSVLVRPDCSATSTDEVVVTVAQSCPAYLSGNVVSRGTALGADAFDAGEYAGGEWSGNSWYESQWLGNSWYGNSWYGNSWYGNSWYGNSWYGNSWYGNSWYGESESGDPSTSDRVPFGQPVPGSAWYGAWG